MSWVVDGRKVKLVVVGQTEDMVLQVQTVRFSLRSVRTGYYPRDGPNFSPRRWERCICHPCKLHRGSASGDMCSASLGPRLFD